MAEKSARLETRLTAVTPTAGLRLLAVISLLGALVRVWGLSDWAFTGDSAFHLVHAESFQTALESIRYDTHPPAFYLLEHALLRAGLSAWPLAVRAGALVPGVLLIPACYWLGKRAFGVAGGLALALLAAFSNEIVLQSQEIRHYGLLLLSEVLLLGVALTPRPGHRSLAALALLSLLVLYTHYAAALVVGAAGIVFAARWQHREAQSAGGLRRWTACLGAGTAVFLAWSPALRVALGHASDAGDLADRLLTTPGRVATFLYRLQIDPFVPPDGPLPILIGVLFLAGLAALVKARRWAICALSLLPLGLAVALSFAGRYPLDSNRYALFLVPSLLLPIGAVAELLASARSRGARPLLALAGAALLLSWGLGRPSSFAPDSLRERSPHWLYRRSELEGMLARIDARPAPLVAGIATHWSIKAEEAQRPPWAIFRDPREGFRLRAPIAKICRVWNLTLPAATECMRDPSLDDRSQVWALVNALPTPGEPPMPLPAIEPEPLAALAAERCLVAIEAVAHRENVLALIDVPASRRCAESR
jgi:hypothetical protein